MSRSSSIWGRFCPGPDDMGFCNVSQMVMVADYRFWLILCVVAFVRDLPKTKFNLNMWSAAYPIGIYGVAVTQLAIDLDSVAFRVISSIILVVSVLYWLYLIAYTLPMVLSGELFLAEMYEKDKKEREGGQDDHDESGHASLRSRRSAGESEV